MSKWLPLLALDFLSVNWRGQCPGVSLVGSEHTRLLPTSGSSSVTYFLPGMCSLSPQSALSDCHLDASFCLCLVPGAPLPCQALRTSGSHLPRAWAVSPAQGHVLKAEAHPALRFIVLAHPSYLSWVLMTASGQAGWGRKLRPRGEDNPQDSQQGQGRGGFTAWSHVHDTVCLGRYAPFSSLSHW